MDVKEMATNCGRGEPPRFVSVPVPGPKLWGPARTCPRADFWLVILQRAEDMIRIAANIVPILLI